ncbi:hypothetical protein Tco_0057874, partial [Tanacetum coccineum]
MLSEPDYAHDDSNLYGCAGLRLAFDPTKSPDYKVVHARSNSCEINDALHWLETKNWQLTNYNLNIEDHEHPIITTIQIPQGLQQGRNFFESYGNMLPMIIGIQIPHMLHLEGKLFKSRGCLVLVRRDYIGSREFTIYEMTKGCSVWWIKYIVDTDDFMAPLPEGWIERVGKHLNKAKQIMDINKGKEKMVIERATSDESSDPHPFKATSDESSDHNPFQVTFDESSDHNPFQATSDESSDHNPFEATSDDTLKSSFEDTCSSDSTLEQKKLLKTDIASVKLLEFYAAAISCRRGKAIGFLVLLIVL